jgi:hypothetical protein
MGLFGPYFSYKDKKFVRSAPDSVFKVSGVTPCRVDCCPCRVGSGSGSCSWPFLQTLDLAGKACQGKYLRLFGPFVNNKERKMFCKYYLNFDFFTE